MIYTTLNKIRAHGPCESGWTKLLAHLGKTKADDARLSFKTILKSNGLDDTLWCLRSICPEHEAEVRLFAADCAERVLHIFEKQYPNDKRPRQAIEAARQFARGEIDESAWAAAGAAARDAAWAAGDAARDAAWAAAWAAGDAAMAAAGAAERKIQEQMLLERFCSAKKAKAA